MANSSNTGSGPLTITGQVGLNVEALTTGTNNTSILLGTTTIPTGNWALYSASSYASHLAGPLLLGTTTNTASTRLQFVAGTTAAAGILFGTDTTLYRSAADTLKTDDAFVTASTLTTAAGVAWDLGAANVVNPTSPNRTLTVSAAGTTYYLAAKTTND